MPAALRAQGARLTRLFSTTGGFNRPQPEHRGMNAWESVDPRHWKEDHRGYIWVGVSVGAAGALVWYTLSGKKDNKAALQSEPRSKHGTEKEVWTTKPQPHSN